MQLTFLLVVASVVLTSASNNMECTFCTISLGLIEQNQLQLKLKDKLMAKCSEKSKLERKACEASVEKVINSLLKKAQPDAMCGKLSMCDGFEQCKLFPQWPLEELPSKPKEWPTERRQLLEISNLRDHHVLKEYFQGIVEKFRLPERDHSFYTAARVVVALMQDIHADDSAVVEESDGCDQKDIKCHLEAVGKHLPVQDSDQDSYGSSYETLRGTDWRGTDCDDKNNDVYPGRLSKGGDLDIDHNCNAIVGGNSTGSYEDMFCSGLNQPHGLIMLGDSATAHFHLPPQWVTADGWNLHGAKNAIKNELDYPMCSWGTAHVDNPEKCPFQDSVPGLPDGQIVSLYTQLRDRNRCMNQDFQNVGVNGARITSSSGLVDAMARNQESDAPALVWLTLLGNDVCNGHPGTGHMTTPEDFYDKAMETLTRLDTLLPRGSTVVSTALFDGELLYKTMENQQHPVGNTYPQFYDYLNCMQESPCYGWLNSNATMRAETTQRAHELDAVYRNIYDNERSQFKNFEYVYFQPDWQGMFDAYAKEKGVENLPNLIEKSDGFHPSQAANALFAIEFFSFFEKNHPEALGSVNPHNAEIDALFFSP